MNEISSAPVVVEVWRGAAIESRHQGAAVVADGGGRIVGAWGDIERPVFPRSAIKPLQAISVVDSGAAATYGLDETEIALACASHDGEPAHVDAVARWLARLDLSAGDLECGVHAPYNAEANAALVRAGRPPTALHNNCSGKHSGMLTLARHAKAATTGYIDLDHPVQRAWRQVLEEMSNVDLAAAPAAIDGCSIPTIALPLTGLARAAARFASSGPGDSPFGDACATIRRAMAAAPFMVGGSGRFCTRVMEATAGAALVKVGAEGVYFGALPKAGLGIAVKIDDGATRAAEVAVAALLARFGDFDDDGLAAIGGLAEVPLYNRRGIHVGDIKPSVAWIDGS
ncbi:MAG: asparaginase [Alphaproteobacteria bacterium]|nr:asparaginase [Alphaproteobacteria bacterium]